MLRSFHLVAIAHRRPWTTLLRVPLRQDTQDALKASWSSQYSSFYHPGIELLHYAPGYKLDPDQRFVIDDFDLPCWLTEMRSTTVGSLDPIRTEAKLMASISSLAGLGQDENGRELILFQNFSRSRVIEPGRLLLMAGWPYIVSDHAVALDSRLNAVYFVENRRLIFDNFRAVNTFLPLHEHFEPATEEKILSILAHDKLAPEDPLALAKDANQWFRTRFAMLDQSGVLDEFTPEQIQSRAERYRVRVELDAGRIVFPAGQEGAKRLLQFLNEEIFRGAITDALYETNSKRPTDE